MCVVRVLINLMCIDCDLLITTGAAWLVCKLIGSTCSFVMLKRLGLPGRQA